MIPKNKKVCLVSLGCPKNTVDSQIMLQQLVDNGYHMTDRPEDAQVIVINTCAFIDDALEESIEWIIEAGRYKQEKLEKLLVAGCLSKRYGKKVFDELPEVDAILDTGNYASIAKAVRKSYETERCAWLTDHTDINYLNQKRAIDTDYSYEYVKIAEGCSNRCSFCIIPALRGRYQSREQANILDECDDLIEAGKRELIVIAQDTARYGMDRSNRPMLHTLLEAMAKKPIFRIRVLYTYPEYWVDDLFHVFSNTKMARYLDLPIQHVSDAIRTRMRRKGSFDQIKRVLEKIRHKIPGVYIRTTLMTGFPGETEQDFESMIRFVQSDWVDYAGIFAFSAQEGTKAASMEDRIDQETIERRYRVLSKISTDRLMKKNQAQMGQTVEVLCDGLSDDGIFYQGRTEFQAPSIDPAVYFTAMRDIRVGEKVRVLIKNIQQMDMIGEAINECGE